MEHQIFCNINPGSEWDKGWGAFKNRAIKRGGRGPNFIAKYRRGGRCLGNFITQLMYKSAAVLGWLFLTFFTLKGEVEGVVNFLTFLRGGCKFSCISHTGGG